MPLSTTALLYILPTAINFLETAPNVPTTLLSCVFKTFAARLDHNFLGHAKFLFKVLARPSSMLHGPIDFLDPARTVPTTLLDRVVKTFAARLDHIFLGHAKSLSKT